MAYKYPWIPREYYAAVMYACKMIREYGTFNKSCHIAAEYYGVDEDEVRRHVSARSGAGKKGRKSATAGRKFKYWLVVPGHECEALGVSYEPENVMVKRAVDYHHAAHNWLKTQKTIPTTDSYYEMTACCMQGGDENGYDHKEDAERAAWEMVKKATANA